jgi:hypothetical protein
MYAKADLLSVEAGQRMLHDQSSSVAGIAATVKET